MLSAADRTNYENMIYPPLLLKAQLHLIFNVLLAILDGAFALEAYPCENTLMSYITQQASPTFEWIVAPLFVPL